MEMTGIQAYSWSFLYDNHPLLFLENYVHWSETPDSHIYSAEIPGVRKEEIKVEVEDARYLIIRTVTDAVVTGTDPEERRRSFMRKFRLPSRIDVEGISAGYENGVLTVTVPRSYVSRGLHIVDPSDLPDTSSLEVIATARAA